MIALNRQVDIAIVGDARSTLKMLLEKIRKYTPRRKPRESLKEYKEIEKA